MKYPSYFSITPYWSGEADLRAKDNETKIIVKMDKQ